MSNDEIERRLRELHPSPPRPGLRGEVLDAMRTEAARVGGARRFDDFLAGPLPWASAAALLVGLVLTHLLLTRNHTVRTAALVGTLEAERSTEAPSSLSERREWILCWLRGDCR